MRLTSFHLESDNGDKFPEKGLSPRVKGGTFDVKSKELSESLSYPIKKEDLECISREISI